LSSDAFELVSLGMRYWFVILGFLIVLRAARWAWHDHRAYMHTLRSLPDAGYMGEIVNLDTGAAQALPREGVMGSGKACDVQFRGLRRRELVYEFREGKGILLMPCHKGNQILLEGAPLIGNDYALHGSRLSFPGYALRMRLFDGLDIPRRDTGSIQDDAGFMPGVNDFNLEDLANEGPASIQLPLTPPVTADFVPQGQVLQTEYLQEQMSWVYASPPAAQQPDQSYPWEETPDDAALHTQQGQFQRSEGISAEPQGRRRRSKRHEN